MKTLKIKSQKGSALLFSFILMIALTFIAIASVNTGIMEIKMAGSVEEQMNAFQTAVAGIDFALSDPSFLPSTGALNIPIEVINCTNNSCTSDLAAVPTLPGSAFDTPDSGDESIVATVERTLDCGLPPRTKDASSLLNFSSFAYEATADIDKTTTNRGRSYQLQGYLTLGPKC